MADLPNPTKKYLITSALPYINGVKHLGNLVGSLLPADVYARFLRQCGCEVLYVCATDEHGTPAELAALAANMSVQAYCAQMHTVQAALYARFHLSFDVFSRTSEPANHRLTQTIYQQLKQQGYIEQRTLQQLYSPADARFLPDRYIIGTCPRCGYQAARGDQCEKCATLLEPSELLAPHSALTPSSKLQLRTTQHIFLKLSQLQPAVAAWVKTQSSQWSELTTSIAHKWLNEGLQDRCISRDLSWGVPVPEAELAGKVFYVWFDAPVGYIAATCAWAAARGTPQAWRDWWCQPQTQQVDYTQFMAKDNIPFHTIMFPAMLLGTQEAWQQPTRIKGFNWLNYYGEKFSTSASRGVFMDAALELFPADVWRYSLLAMAPEAKDSVFTWEEFQQKLNKDLNDNLGNFVNRVLRFTQSHWQAAVLPATAEPVTAAEVELQVACQTQLDNLSRHLQNLECRKASETLRDLWALGNLYIDRQAPWKSAASDLPATARVLCTCFNLIHLYATAMQPLMPATSAQIKRIFPAATAMDWRAPVDLQRLAPGTPYQLIPPLFSKLDATTLQSLKTRFARSI